MKVYRSQTVLSTSLVAGQHESAKVSQQVQTIVSQPDKREASLNIFDCDPKEPFGTRVIDFDLYDFSC